MASSKIWNHQEIANYANKRAQKIHANVPKHATGKQKDAYTRKANTWLNLVDIANNAIPEPSTRKPLKAYVDTVKNGALAKKALKTPVQPTDPNATSSADIDRRNAKLINFSKKQHKSSISRQYNNTRSSLHNSLKDLNSRKPNKKQVLSRRGRGFSL